jgi:hypothetical protein
MSTLRKVRIDETWNKDQARALNEHHDDLLSVLNGGVRVADQFRGLKTAVRFNTDNDAPKVGPFAVPPRWVLCLGARTLTAPSEQVGGATVSWTMVGSNVVITAISGLTASTDYTVDLLCLEG